MTKTLGLTALAVALALMAGAALFGEKGRDGAQAGAAPNRALAYQAAMAG